MQSWRTPILSVSIRMSRSTKSEGWMIEMTLLPLLYPEVFQRLNLTPPRGVLFHGPPGTGKTLLARALAANCRSNGKSILGREAERQLRLLFEEARNQQPSIIFFDEIDGLAPVRSSKQDQIHASIVSTLLALMDGMDGRGQVVVIGATNRPDAIDPALRRPGRFDREFFFPLPSLSARERILQIMTRNWAGWEAEKGEANAKGLAKLTKGYGGADLRVLCVEARGEAVDGGVVPMLYPSDVLSLGTPDGQVSKDILEDSCCYGCYKTVRYRTLRVSSRMEHKEQKSFERALPPSAASSLTRD
ncbi:Tat-binding 7 [Grifola frondosa]|uniref:Tat-binding 7 n=1 Tax=Grifola frondosa TaxID=5627 RepID=A0A1C7LNA4_GRIFR|nr:Tat-binding 7 [Grifola frondosa]